jgi:hypothetical protein
MIKEEMYPIEIYMNICKIYDRNDDQYKIEDVEDHKGLLIVDMVLVVPGEKAVEVVGAFGGVLSAVGTVDAGVEIEAVADEGAEEEVIDAEFDEEEEEADT